MKKLLATLVLGWAVLGFGEDLKIADFEKSTDGFKGAFIFDGSVGNGSKGSGKLENKDKPWIASGKTFDNDLEKDFLELSFWIKSTDAKTIAVRLKDSTGQNFQHRLSFENDGKWHQLKITDMAKSMESWGGANDKKWHAPARSVSFILEAKGSVLIDDVEAKLDPRVAIKDLKLKPGVPSNIFVAGEKVSIPVETKGDSLMCVATDYWGKEVYRETVKAADNKAVITPPSKNGYFLLQVEARKGEATIGKAFISYAVIPDVKVEDKANSPFGAMTHFAQGMPVDILPLLAKAGIVSIRDEHYWGQVETNKGEYVFPDQSGRYMEACEKIGMDPLIAMTFGNKLYDHQDGPSTPEGFDGYGNYGLAILEEYGDQIRWLEIWNEYNGTWAPPEAKKSFEARYSIYTEMLKVAYDKIKGVRPDVKVLGAASVLIPLPYIEGIFRLGGLDYMDGVVIHPYRGKPEGVEKEVAELRELMRKYNKGQEKEIWVTETGRMDKSEFDWEKGKKLWEKGRRAAASYLTRQYVLVLSENVMKIYWYLAADHMEFVSMGLLRGRTDVMGKFMVAPPYVTYATLISQLHDSKIVGREAVNKYSRAYVFQFQNNRKEEIRVCWATYPSRLEVTASKPITSVNIVGETKTLNPTDGKIVIDLVEEPVYLRGEIQGVREIEPEEKIIAASVDDYGKNQGFNGWYYGYFDGKGGSKGAAGAYPDDDFKEMKVVETMWGEKWAGPIQYLSIGSGNAHPQKADGKDIWAVRRWKSNYAGKVVISGNCEHGRGGDGIEFKILVDGKPIYSQKVGGSSPQKATIKVETELKEGSLVDFCVAPNENPHFDATSYDMMIKTVKK